MTTEENKAIIRHYYESIGKEETVNLIRQAENPVKEAEKIIRNALGKAFAPDSAMHYPEAERTLNEDIQRLANQVGAFPDMKITVNDIIAEGDKVVTRFTNRFTHTGQFMGIPATGKKIKLEAISVYRMENGKVVEGWWIGDMLGVMQQLGLVPKG